MKVHFVILMFFFCCVTTSYGQIPSLHFKADKVDSTSLASFGKSKNGIQNEMTPEGSMINYNPALDFDGIDDYLEITGKIKDPSNTTVFTVFRSENDSLMEAEIWGMHGESYSLALTTSRILSSEMQTSYEGVDPENVILHAFTESNRSSNTGGNQNSFLSIGVVKKDTTNTFFKGSIAEVMAFDKRLRGKDRQIIESTLALKYGITLNNGEDYMVSKKRTVWETDEDNEFSYNIAGIGRDSSQDIHQKQSTSSNDPGFMVIGIDSIVGSNQQNEGRIKNNHFLVWGDNKAPLMESKDNNAAGRAPLLQRKWLMKATGRKSGEVSTQLKIDAKKLFGGLGEEEDYSLIIDRSGSGDFQHETCSYMSPSGLSDEGILTFNNILWDIDGSGKDAFSFSLKKDLIASLSGNGSAVCNEGLTVLNYEVEGGIPPYSYTLTSPSGYTRDWKSDQDKEMGYSIRDIPAGNYTLSVTDFTEAVAQAEYSVSQELPVEVDLGPDRTLVSKGEDLILEPQISNREDIATFEWSGDNEFSSEEESVYVSEPGSYTLTVTTQSGCTYSDSITITDNFVQEFTLYPNPSPGGKYDILVGLSGSSDINIRVYNLMGGLVSEYQVENQEKVRINGDVIKASGVYTVVLQTSKGITSIKLIVK